MFRERVSLGAARSAPDADIDRFPATVSRTLDIRIPSPRTSSLPCMENILWHAYDASLVRYSA